MISFGNKQRQISSSLMDFSLSLTESIPLAGPLGDSQTNKPLNRGIWGFSKLLSRGPDKQVVT